LDNSSVTLRANGPITVQDITALGGGILLNSDANVTTRNLTARQAITVTGDSNISTGSITSQGGNVTLTSDGNINVLGDISSSGGDIALTSGDAAVTQNLNSSSPTQGGAITVRATNSITTRQINSSSANGSGGNVLLDPRSDVQVDAIDARGGSNGRGGNVTVVAGQYFRAVSTIPELAPLTSISTAGGQGGGNIFIRHGGNGDIPFVVGANTQNGTLGAITTGNYTLAPTQSIEGDVTLGDIQITTSATNCVLQCPPPPPPPPPAPLPNISFVEAQTTLQRVLEQTGVQPALIYVGFVPAQSSIDIGFEQREATSTQQVERYLGRSGSSDGLSVLFKPKESDRLEIVIVTSSGEPIRRSVDGVTRGDIQRVTRQLLGQITDRSKENSTAYLRPAQQLYEWLITPIEADLQREKISNLSFIMDAGLRFVPIATLYDGQQFLVEKYSVGLMPSLGLTDTRRVDLRNAQVLAMGASQFTNQLPLPAVPVELSEINSIWQGEALLNSAFTPSNLKLQREQRPFGIVHLATHAEFNRGAPQNSYIQFWNQQLGLDQIRQLGLNNPPVELLVLSACRTALGNEDAELGFAGFAVQAGVRSVLASLWSVSDVGTLALMSEFYEQLRTAPTRSEALRRAQVAMLRGQVRISNGILTTSSGRNIALPATLTGQNAPNLPYPLYWAAFTMIGNPW
jgi:CHAT domain-containing protein